MLIFIAAGLQIRLNGMSQMTYEWPCLSLKTAYAQTKTSCFGR